MNAPTIRGPLFGPVYPLGAGSRRPETSRDAAARVNLTLADRQEQVYEAIKRRGELGATADEICLDLGRVRNSIAPRFTELKARGLLRIIGKRGTPTGAQAHVYVVVPHAR
jgi:hypothetical protein